MTCAKITGTAKNVGLENLEGFFPSPMKGTATIAFVVAVALLGIRAAFGHRIAASLPQVVSFALLTKWVPIGLTTLGIGLHIASNTWTGWNKTV